MSKLRNIVITDNSGGEVTLTTENNVPVEVFNSDGGAVDVQHPFPTNGDSVYYKDIDIANSDNGDFTGNVTDYFDSLKTVNSNMTGDNPKSIMLWFNRTIYSHAIGFGCDNLAKGFGTSITVKLLGSGEAVRFTKTYTAIDPNSFLAEFGAKAFNGVILEFNTATEVCLSNLTIGKSSETNATLHGTDPSGEVQDVIVTEDGSLAIEDNSSGLSISEGKIQGKTFIHKFGSALDFNKNDGFVTVWDGAEDGEPYEKMVYTYSTTDDIDTLSSDTVGNTQLTEIQGLDINFDIVVQTATLNGQTAVTLDTPLIRIFRIKNIGTVDYSGHVFVSVSGTLTAGTPTPANLRGVVHAENNQTEMAVFTIPSGKTGYMRDWYASTSGAKKDSSHVIRVIARPYSQVFQLKHKAAIVESGTSYIKHDYEEPEVFTEKTDIEIQMNTDQDAASVAAGFDIVLVDN